MIYDLNTVVQPHLTIHDNLICILEHGPRLGLAFLFNIRRLCFIPFTSPRGRNIYVQAFKRFMTVVIIFRKCLLSIIPKQTSKRQQPNLFPVSRVWGKNKWKKGSTFSRSTGSAMCLTFLKNRCGSSPFIEWKEVPGRHCESK